MYTSPEAHNIPMTSAWSECWWTEEISWYNQPKPLSIKLQEEPRENPAWSYVGDIVPAKLEEEKKKERHVSLSPITLQQCPVTSQ